MIGFEGIFDLNGAETLFDGHPLLRYTFYLVCIIIGALLGEWFHRRQA